MSSICLKCTISKNNGANLKKNRMMKGVLKLLSVTYCDVKLARKPADEDMLQIGNKELIKFEL